MLSPTRQIFNKADGPPLSERMKQVGADLAGFLAGLKPTELAAAERRLMAIRQRREAVSAKLDAERARQNRMNPSRGQLSLEESALGDEIASIDAELATAREAMMAAREAFSGRFRAKVDARLRPNAPLLAEAADAIEALHDLLRLADTFAWRNALEIPRYSDAAISIPDLRRLIGRLAGD